MQILKCGCKYLTIFITYTNLKMWIENVPTHDPFDFIVSVLAFE
jgi:hypothetical protein